MRRRTGTARRRGVDVLDASESESPRHPGRACARRRPGGESSRKRHFDGDSMELVPCVSKSPCGQARQGRRLVWSVPWSGPELQRLLVTSCRASPLEW